MTTFTFEELIPAKCCIAPEIPIAIYKLEATGFPVWPTCSLCGLQPKSETGLEQAVAAPKTSASSSIIPQFSGPFKPRPPETTISAFAILTLSVDLSTDSTESPYYGIADEKSSTEALPPVSTKPKELLDRPTTLTSVVISILAKALFVNADRLTVNGATLDGASTTLDA